MIHLDTNYLLGSLASPSALRSQVMAWFRAGEELAVSSIVWSEFLTGPVTPQQLQDAHGIIQGRIVPFNVREAEIAAKLFNHIGRKRAMRTDCFVAATAVCARVPLATLNQKDFVHFRSFGLHLA
jgi:predicted nucleic acid-binding protein